MTSHPNMVTVFQGNCSLRVALERKRACKLKSQSSQKTRLLKFVENSSTSISGRFVLEEINTMERFGIGSKVGKSVQTNERDGSWLDRRKNRDEIIRELGQPPRDHYRFAYTLCPIRVDYRWLQCAHDTRRSIFRWLLLTERTSRRESCICVCASFPFGRWLFTSRRGRNCRLYERTARKRLYDRLLLNIREPVDGNVYDLSLESMRENWRCISMCTGCCFNSFNWWKKFEKLSKRIGYFSIIDMNELSVRSNWM